MYIRPLCKKSSSISGYIFNVSLGPNEAVSWFFLNHVSSVYVAVVRVLNDTKQELEVAIVFKLFLVPEHLNQP